MSAFKDHGGNPKLTGTAQVTVTTAATLIIGDVADDRVRHIHNTHATATVYLGVADVTSSNGYPLVAGASEIFTTSDAIYGVVASSTAIVGLLREGVS